MNVDTFPGFFPSWNLGATGVALGDWEKKGTGECPAWGPVTVFPKPWALQSSTACVSVTQLCPTLCLPGFSVHGFSWQEHWSG